MNQHRYLRAYMAGITFPTLVVLLAMTAFTIARYVFNVPQPIERVIVFPLAVVPNVWGAWNILWLLSGRRIPIGVFGGFLPFLLVPGDVVRTKASSTVPLPGCCRDLLPRVEVPGRFAESDCRGYDLGVAMNH